MIADFSTVRNDFEARLRFRSATEGGRQTCRLTQGYRCDFSYKDKLDDIFMIWPVFLDSSGEPLSEGAEVFTNKEVNARMVIINDDLRVTLHRERINEGVEFVLRECSRIVADGVVTKIVELPND